MSSFPQILRTTKSALLKPAKQGGIYALKITPVKACNTVQPQQFFSINENKVGQSQILTNNTSSHRHQRNLSLANFTRHTVSSQTQRRPPSRIVSSRQSAREFKKQPVQDYGKSKLSSYAIAETAQSNYEQAESLVHRVNEALKTAQKCDEELFEVVRVTFESRSHILRIHDQIDDKMSQIKKQAEVEFQKLRKVLSGLRRQTLIDVKVNKKQIEEVEEQFDSISVVLDSMDHRGYQLYKTVFN